MIEIVRGNILEADAEAIVNTVNCVGFMGKGIALQFKQAHPDNFDAYRQAIASSRLLPKLLSPYGCEPCDARLMLFVPLVKKEAGVRRAIQTGRAFFLCMHGMSSCFESRGTVIQYTVSVPGKSCSCALVDLYGGIDRGSCYVAARSQKVCLPALPGRC